MNQQWRRSLLRGLAAMAVAAGAVVAVQSLTLPASGQEQGGCAKPDDMGFCREEGWTPEPPAPPAPPDPPDHPGPEPDPGEPGPVDPCPWQRHPDQTLIESLFPEADPGSVLETRLCTPSCPAPPGPCARPPAEIRLVPPEDVDDSLEVAAPSPELVAQWVMAQVPIEDPEVVVYPDAGVPAILDEPTFVEVTNWVGDQNPSDCFAGVCVEITATPTLSFDPGEFLEPGEFDETDGWTAPVVPCEAPGSRFDPASGRAGRSPLDPDGAEPRALAGVDGACAYAFQLRTGAAQRPTEWPASVIVTWEATWTSTVPGQPASGVFEPITVSTAVPRQVVEVQGPVVDATFGSGG